MKPNKFKIMLIALAIAAFIGFGQVPITSALSSKASIAGEVRLVTSGGPHIRMKERRPRPISTSVRVTLEDQLTGKIIVSKKVRTNTKFVLSVLPGTYRVSAQIGPPVVNPRPRECGLPRQIKVRPSRQALVMLACGVIG